MSALTEYIDAWIANDADRVAAAVAEDCIITECYGPVYRGRDCALRWAQAWSPRAGSRSLRVAGNLALRPRTTHSRMYRAATASGQVVGKEKPASELVRCRCSACGAKGIRTPGLFHAMEARYQLRHSPELWSHKRFPCRLAATRRTLAHLRPPWKIGVDKELRWVGRRTTD